LSRWPAPSRSPEQWWTSCAAARTSPDTCGKSGYGLVTAEGKFLKFNESGNARTLTALKKLGKEKDLKAKVTGTLDGDVLKVESLDFQ
jgi:hypothetical protein